MTRLDISRHDDTWTGEYSYPGFKVVALGGNIDGLGYMGPHWCPQHLLEWAASAADRVFHEHGVNPLEALVASRCDRHRVGKARRFFAGRKTREWIDNARLHIAAADEALAAARRQMEYGFSCALHEVH